MSELKELNDEKLAEYKNYCFVGIEFNEVCEKLMGLQKISDLTLKEQTIFWQGIDSISYWTKYFKEN